jgi:hypothetical protein
MDSASGFFPIIMPRKRVPAIEYSAKRSVFRANSCHGNLIPSLSFGSGTAPPDHKMRPLKFLRELIFMQAKLRQKCAIRLARN